MTGTVAPVTRIPPRWTAGLHRLVLPNGATVLVRAVDRPAAAVMIRLNAGYFDEPDSLVGVSHVLEHMVFKGTARQRPGDLARMIQTAGGYVNAATGYDGTTYHAVVPPDRWPETIAGLLDAVTSPALDPEELTRELRVIVEEVKRKRDTPSAVALETLYALLHDRHRIRRWRIGEEEALVGLTAGQLRHFHATHYVPSRMVVTVVAPGDPERMLDRVVGCLATLPARESPMDRGPGEGERVTTRRRRILRGDVRTTELLLGWRSVPHDHPDHVPLAMTATLLGSGRGSLLARALREPGLATGARAFQYTPAGIGALFLTGSCRPGRTEEVLGRMESAVRVVTGSGDLESELARARQVLSGRWIAQLDRVEGLASALTGAEARGDVHGLDTEYEALLSVSARQVRHAVERWLTPDASGLVIYQPTDAGDVVVNGAGGDPIPPLPELTPVVVPTPLSVSRREVKGLRHAACPGVDLIACRLPGTRLASVSVTRLLRHGDPPDLAGRSRLAVRSAVRGAGPYAGTRLALAFERIGGTVHASCSSEAFGWHTTVPGESLGEAADLLRWVSEAPRYDAEQVRHERDLQVDDARRMTDNMSRYPLRLALGGRFPDHRYGIPAGGTPETVERLDESLVRAWHTGTPGGRPVVVVVADQDPDEMVDRLAAGWGDLAAVPSERDAPPSGPEPRPGQVVEERDREQSAIAMIFPGPDRGSVERFAAECWGALAGGLGGRLFEALRDRRSLAYSITAGPWCRRDAGGIVVGLATSPQREDEAREAILAELARFRVEPPEEEAVSRARQYLVGQEQVARQSPGVVAGDIVDAWLFGSGLEEVGTTATALDAVTREAIHALVAESFDPDLRTEGVVRASRRMC